MNEKYILLEDVESLGKAGDTVSVAAGYARNYLLPRKMVMKASKAATRQLQARMVKVEAKRKLDHEAALALAAKIAAAEITIPMKVGEDDQLFGSVTTHAITDELLKSNITVDHHKVILDKPIKQLGAFEVQIKLHHDVVATAKVWVVRA